MLSDDIFANWDARKMQPAPVEAFGKTLFVRKWSARTRAIWEALVFTTDGKSKARREHFLPATVVCSLIDDKGVTVFVALKAEDELVMEFDQVVDVYSAMVSMVSQLDAVELERVYNAAAKLNGLEKDQVGNAEKNSGATPS